MRRPNNTGSISWDKANNKWRAWIKDDEGKRVIKRFAERSDAEGWLAEMRVKLNKGLYVPANDKKFSEFAVEFLDTFCPDIRPKTAADYLHTFSLMKPIYNVPLQKLNAVQAQRMMNKLTCAASTKKKVFDLLRRIIRKAKALKLIEDNFIDAMSTPANARGEKVKIFTEDEIQKILACSKDHPVYKRYYPIIYTAVLTGMRLGEILGLRYADVTPGTITVTLQMVEVYGKSFVSKPKSTKGNRIIHIPEELGNLLLGINNKNVAPTDLIFRTSNNTPMEQTNFTKNFKKIQELAGVEHKNFHCLRHSHASILIQKYNVDIISVSHRLGHAQTSTTLNFYSDYLPGQEDKVVDKLKEFTTKGPQRDQKPTDN